MMSLFLDSNVFIYAFLKPRREPLDNVIAIKEKAKEILKRVSDGEEVVTTVILLSKVANVVGNRAGKGKAAEIVLSMLTSQNIMVLDVSTADYLRVALIAEERNLGINDALAYLKMRELGIDEIYTFDRDFEKLNVKIVRE
ncbi:type II toxin-antitoxin system VapC family toxin [Thermococcus gorgonarius]|nr:type II toxin-antitoxin system VapC family toxin [Thermococcus gorgonarius]